MIAYASRTGNVRHICGRLQELGIDSVEIESGDGLIMYQPFLVFTYTDKLGSAPQEILEFMEKNHALCRGIIVSGNRNFPGGIFCGAALELKRLYDIPIVHAYDLRGYDSDDQKVLAFYQKHMEEKTYEELPTSQQ